LWSKIPNWLTTIWRFGHPKINANDRS
jgi:hypothetical protein